MKEYKAIFDAIEATLFEIGSKKVPLDQIRVELESYKHLEGRSFTDDEYYTCSSTLSFMPVSALKRSPTK